MSTVPTRLYSQNTSGECLWHLSGHARRAVAFVVYRGSFPLDRVKTKRARQVEDLGYQLLVYVLGDDKRQVHGWPEELLCRALDRLVDAPLDDQHVAAQLIGSALDALILDFGNPLDIRPSSRCTAIECLACVECAPYACTCPAVYHGDAR